MYLAKLNIQKSFILTQKGFTHLPNLMPVVIIFLLTFSLSILGNYDHTQKASQRDGKALIQSVERYIEQTASDLYILNNRVSATCAVK